MEQGVRESILARPVNRYGHIRRSEQAVATLESYVPGRMRLRVSAFERRATAALGEFVTAIEAVRGVLRVTSNALTGSVLVDFDPEGLEISELLAGVEAADVTLGLGAVLGESVLEKLEQLPNSPVAAEAHRQLLAARNPGRGAWQALRGLGGPRPLIVVMAGILLLGIRHFSRR